MQVQDIFFPFMHLKGLFKLMKRLKTLIWSNSQKLANVPIFFHPLENFLSVH